VPDVPGDAVSTWPDLDAPTGRRATVYDRHYPDIYRFALALTDNEKQAGDITVRAFARCFARFDHLRDDSALEISLLREVWRSAVPRTGRRVHVPRAADALSRLGLPEAEIEAILPSAREDMWVSPSGEQEQELPEVTPDRDGLRRALRGGRRRFVSMLVAAGLLGAGAATAALTPTEAPERRQLTEVNLPEILPQSLEPVGPRVRVVRGKLGKESWMVNAYAAEHETVCIELRVGDSYGNVHCPSNFKVPIRAFVGPDRRHRTTFLYGYLRSDVTDVSIKEVTSPAVGVQVGKNPEALGFKEPGGFFAVTVPDYLLRMTSRRQGENLGYRIFDLRLKATDGKGKRVGVQRLLLGRPD
jgi:DNA-directed RNA polymerase specialized sigma24 family protein